MTTAVRNCKPDRAAWLANRRKGIGGSEAAAIVGLSPWATPYSIWLDKRGLAPEMVETPAMHFGTVLESAIAEMYMAAEGLRLEKVHDSIAHPLYPEIRCTPDYVDWENPESPILSIKYAPYSKGKWGAPGTDDIPRHYIIQCMQEMAVLNRVSVDVAVSFGYPEYDLYHVRRDLEVEEWLMTQERRWWKTHIIEGVEPPVDGSAAAAEYIAARFPRNVEPLKLASADVNDILATLAAARKEVAAAEERKSTLENQVKAFIGDAAGVESDGFRATWKNTKDSEKTDYEAIALEMINKLPREERMAVLDKYTTLKRGSRRFLFTPKGEAK